MAKFGGALSNLKEARAKKAPEVTPIPEATLEAPEPEKAETKTAATTRGVGRPKGRASNPDYTTTTIMISKKLRADVVAEIALQEKRMFTWYPRDMSDLIENLLTNWVNKERRLRGNDDKS